MENNMNTEWITDRLPTKEDSDVWVTLSPDECAYVVRMNWKLVPPGFAWQPIPKKPEPYVKPKRWTVRFNGDSMWQGQTMWALYDWDLKCSSLPALDSPNHADAAQRIADIYNEVIP